MFCSAWFTLCLPDLIAIFTNKPLSDGVMQCLNVDQDQELDRTDHGNLGLCNPDMYIIIT